MRITKNGETIRVEAIQYHRNGVAGAGFHVVLFTANGYQRAKFVATVFETPYHVSVLDRDLTAQGNVTFGENSWRGDNFEPALREAIRRHEAAEDAKWGRANLQVTMCPDWTLGEM